MAIDQRWFEFLKRHQNDEAVAIVIARIKADVLLDTAFFNFTGKTIIQALQ